MLFRFVSHANYLAVQIDWEINYECQNFVNPILSSAPVSVVAVNLVMLRGDGRGAVVDGDVSAQQGLLFMVRKVCEI